MKITKKQLKQIIKEELENVLNENDSFSYAKENMYALCKMGWSIGDARTLWVASRNGNLSAEEVSVGANQYAKEHGEASVLRVWGIERATFARDECDRFAR
jgi:hypothetical protein